MNKYKYSNSESLVLSLSKEIEYIRSRSKNINNSLRNCHNKTLFKRLVMELEILNKTKIKITNISKNMFRKYPNNLSIEFFLELTKRSNMIQQYK